MDQFEKQFQTADDQERTFEPTPTSVPPSPGSLIPAPPVALVLPRSDATSVAVSPTPGPLTAVQSAPVAAGPSVATSTQAAAADHFVPEPQSIPASTPTPAVDDPGARTEVPVAAETPDPRRRRRRVLATVTVMAVGLLIVLIGAGVMFLENTPAPTVAGSVQAVGIVTSLGAGGNGCSPVARFAARGGSFSTVSTAPISPCPFGLGQSVTVTYAASNVAGSGHIVIPNPMQQYAWLAPVLGVVVFIAGFIGFLVLAGSIVGGVRIIRGTDQRRRRSTAMASK